MKYNGMKQQYFLFNVTQQIFNALFCLILASRLEAVTFKLITLVACVI